MSKIRTNFDNLISAATTGQDMKTPAHLLEEIEDDAHDSIDDVPRLSRQWLRRMQRELKHWTPDHIQHDGAVAVLQYIQDKYWAKMSLGAQADEEDCSDKQRDRLSEVVEEVLVGWGSFFHCP